MERQRKKGVPTRAARGRRATCKGRRRPAICDAPAFGSCVRGRRRCTATGSRVDGAALVRKSLHFSVFIVLQA